MPRNHSFAWLAWGAGILGLSNLLLAQPAKSDDKAKLQGVWKVTGLETQGEKAPAEAASGVRFVFDGDKLHIHHGDEERKAAEVKLNPSVNPKSIDLIDAEEKKTVPGIYELDGDTLRLCLGEAGDEKSRPANFVTRAGVQQSLFVLKRDREGASAEDKDGEELLRRFREAGARTQSANNLRQIGIAMHNYHNDFGYLPRPAIYSKDGKPLLSWRVAVLPYLEQDNLYRQFRLDEPWDSEHNKPLLAQMPKVFAIANVKSKEPHSTFYRVLVSPGDARPGAMFIENEKITLGQITVMDGTSNTLMIVEAGEPAPWTKPDELGYLPDKPLPKLGGAFRDGFHACFGDVSVRFISKNIFVDEPALRALITRNGGETVDVSRYFK
jgi:uncharacterized protein (TIGR03067 family)